MCCCEGYGFQTVKSKIGYRMKSESLAHFPENWSIAWRFKSTLRKPGFPFKKMKLANLSILQFSLIAKKALIDVYHQK